ncbi:translation initiation factor eIF-2, alpha subunit [Thermococcus onnurineus NA1]|uniref:Translation initiation factor 2 subunit alpha n=1 Tax=Thermococcus onnurineus (strain NA1) TaxID=523850 RepID=IF2A_THEON|nr:MULTISPECIES: translation initiation factor IF-2 subunit alpha [Thermococcus]B6YT35.1 RecName: Full=Translation initiation factor 2 subunit alpha; AltName: Full=aIF2-alpha; AltName: Full=eIF-2-alpha [Thermococcus onnurineus NA1]ACJ15722.1 translation initiation factor eIF-2, alpha subunit [Thermococcus onnurineus NA1]NJE42550.1 translation initiation factor IF-2 subunit alpha [Thermococcus sp. GR6]NJE46216.1 translation initiation factor IF-2 subunit alpha [Thermococcus sp. GR7]NJE79509.1 t
MPRKAKEYPEEGEFVIATVKSIHPYGAFLKLDEYPGKEGFMHISEVASTWVKNIRDYVKEGQKVVAKVIRVDPNKGHIDLSLKRVNQQQRKAKLQEYKRAQKAENLLKMAAEKLGKDFEMAWQEVWVPLEEEYGEVYAAFEDAAQNGIEVLKGIIPEEWLEPLNEIVQNYVEVPTVTIDAEFEITVPKPNGIEIIKEALIRARDRVNEDKDIEVKFTYQGAPRYRIDITAPDYYKAEEVLEDIAEEILRVIKQAGGEATLLRKEKRIKKIKRRGA